MLAIYKKELHAYFTSVIGWLYLAVFLLGVGFYHYIYNLSEAYANFSYALAGSMLIFILIIPIFTMRIMAEESRQKTDQLLYTSPVSITKIVLGKFLSMITIMFLGIAVISLYPLTLTKYGEMNLPMEYASIFGFFLVGCAFMAIGLFLSSLTENQIIAAILTMVVVLLTCFIDTIANRIPADHKTALIVFSVLFLAGVIVTYVLMKSVLVSSIITVLGEGALIALYIFKPEIYDGSVIRVFGWFSMVNRFYDFTYGILDLSAVLYYLSIIGLFLFFTVQVVKKKRWS